MTQQYEPYIPPPCDCHTLCCRECAAQAAGDGWIPRGDIAVPAVGDELTVHLADGRHRYRVTSVSPDGQVTAEPIGNRPPPPPPERLA